MSHMKYWDKLHKPPLNVLKPIQAGRLRGKSDINPQWRMQAMTETFGPCGIGKSHLAGALFREVFPRRRGVQFWKPNHLIRYLRVKEAEEQEIRLQECINAPLFILDDIGIGNATEFFAQMLYEIVDGRYMAERDGLIVTSNLSLQQLAEKMGDDRLCSRIAAMCHVFAMTGKDNRLS